ncbi:MAG: branched-chain amino acid ABC transporter permease [Alphaproteobacteria bacterium]|nr:branched-chain amino acid ABC transporter permease [Alphaproteobacteria bacterium]MDA8676085.1 branched-chain amino acid ABC transporter permease [Alphaproteobacteria bacterium]MDG2466790.1 branched-chain amino acid ABC transporter permease [Alphaproteobacteria bacterium]
MSSRMRIFSVFFVMAALLVIVGMYQSWNVAFSILNLCVISSIMALGVNVQWGYAGLVNFGVMGFVAVGGLAGVIVSMPPVEAAWAAGGVQLMGGFAVMGLVILAATIFWKKTAHLKNTPRKRYLGMALIIILGYALYRFIADPAIDAIEAVEPAMTGYLGGLGLPILFSWIVGAIAAGLIAMLIGRIALGLRSDYLAIATLGISEIIIYVIKNEDWMARGVKNVNGLPRPVPYELDLQKEAWVNSLADSMNYSVINTSSLIVKISYLMLFVAVLIGLFILAEKALRSPWGRMMRAIRDNEVAAEAMGKDVKSRHLQIFIIGSAVLGLAGAMLTTLDGQFTPASYQPLRYTFLIWVMVIVGGSGNNYGSIIGGFIIWFFWIEAEPLGLWLIEFLTSGMSADSALKAHLLESAAHTRLMTMGLIMMLVLRFAPKGLIPEAKR